MFQTILTDFNMTKENQFKLEHMFQPLPKNKSKHICCKRVQLFQELFKWIKHTHPGRFNTNQDISM